MHSYDYPRPALTADVIALTFHQGALKVLMIERAHAPFEGHWALPGGFVDEGESPREAAARASDVRLTVPVSAPAPRRTDDRPN